MTIILDQRCASLADRVHNLAPVFVFRQSGGSPVTPDASLAELRTSLLSSGLPAPYLMVATSFVGFTALLFASRHPQEVAGLVLVDSSHPGQSEAAIAALPANLLGDPEVLRFRDFLGGFGPVWEESCRLISECGSIGDIPLVVLVAGRPPMPAVLPPKVQCRLTDGWHALQRDHAHRSTCGELIIVKDCGHNIAADAPDEVVASILKVIKKIQERTKQWQ